MDKTFLVHGTSFENLVSILKHGYLDPKTKERQMDDKLDGLFTQLIFSGISYPKRQIPYWSRYALVISLDILKHKRYKAFLGISGGEDIPYIEFNRKNPDLTEYKHEIADYVKKNHKHLQDLTFMHSNEVVFYEKIPIKYVIGIVMSINKKETERLEELKTIKQLADKRDINLIISNKYRGLDDFVNLIS